MEYKTYKVKQGQYGGIVDSTIRIPDKLKLITGGEHDLGNCIHNGNLHYLGIIEGDIVSVYPELKGLHVYAKQCGKYVIITINDISFVEPYPYMITADELNKEFDLSKYFIVTWSGNLKLLNMKKILRINSEFNIEVLKVTHQDYFGVGSMETLVPDIEELDAVLTSNFGFSDNMPLAAKVVEGDIANDYWRTLINNVTSKFDINIQINKVNVDYAHDLFKNQEYEELDDYINMRKAKYINVE